MTIARLASVPLLLGLVVVAVTLLRLPAAGRRAPETFGLGLGLGLEFFLAAGLLRLSAVADLRSLAVVAVVIALRKLTTTGVGFAVRALGPSASAGARRG